MSEVHVYDKSICKDVSLSLMKPSVESVNRKQCIPPHIEKVVFYRQKVRYVSEHNFGSRRARVWGRGRSVLVEFQVLKCPLWRLRWKSSAPSENSWEQLIAILNMELVQQKRNELKLLSGSSMFEWFCWNLTLWHLCGKNIWNTWNTIPCWLKHISEFIMSQH